jgi:hypothetical protein
LVAAGSIMTRDEEDQAIYAVALLTRSELTSLGPAFARAWPVEGTPCFGELLATIDEADRAFWRRKDEEQPSPQSNDLGSLPLVKPS